MLAVFAGGLVPEALGRGQYFILYTGSWGMPGVATNQIPAKDRH